MTDLSPLTKEELAEAKRWLNSPNNNTMWLGEWAAKYGDQLVLMAETLLDGEKGKTAP